MDNPIVGMVVATVFAVFLAAILIAFISQTVKVKLFAKFFGFNPKNVRRENGGNYYKFETKVITAMINQFGAVNDLVVKFIAEYANKDPVPDCAYTIFADGIWPEIRKFHEMYDLAAFFSFRPKKEWKEKILELEKKAEKIAAGPPECVFGSNDEVFWESMSADKSMV